MVTLAYRGRRGSGNPVDSSEDGKVPARAGRGQRRRAGGGRGVGLLVVACVLVGSHGAPAFAVSGVACAPTQITRTTGDSNAPPAISADGTRTAFRSTADLTGQNPDGNAEIFLFDTITSRLVPVTIGAGRFVDGNQNVGINGDGTRIALISNGDLTGENPAGHFEVFLVDTTTSTVTQITHTSASVNKQHIAISGDGTRIAFESNGDLTGGNPDGNVEIFLFDTTPAASPRSPAPPGAPLGSPRSVVMGPASSSNPTRT